MQTVTQSIFKIAEEYQVSWRKAATIRAIIRISEAEISRNQELYNRYRIRRKPYVKRQKSKFVPDTIEDLTRMILDGQFTQLIKLTEQRQRDKINTIVSDVKEHLLHNNRFVILISGPPTSGTIALSRRHAHAFGKRALHVNLDTLKMEGLRNLLQHGTHHYVDIYKGRGVNREVRLKDDTVLILEGTQATSAEVLNLFPSEENRRVVFIDTVPSFKMSDNWPLTSLDLRLMRELLTNNHTYQNNFIRHLNGWITGRAEKVSEIYSTLPNADYVINGWNYHEIAFIWEGLRSEMYTLYEKAREAENERILNILDRFTKIFAKFEEVNKRTNGKLIKEIRKAKKFIPADSLLQQPLGGKFVYEGSREEQRRSSSPISNKQKTIGIMTIALIFGTIDSNFVNELLSGYISDVWVALKDTLGSFRVYVNTLLTTTFASVAADIYVRRASFKQMSLKEKVRSLRTPVAYGFIIAPSYLAAFSIISPFAYVVRVVLHIFVIVRIDTVVMRTVKKLFADENGEEFTIGVDNRAYEMFWLSRGWSVLKNVIVQSTPLEIRQVVNGIFMQLFNIYFWYAIHDERFTLIEKESQFKKIRNIVGSKIAMIIHGFIRPFVLVPRMIKGKLAREGNFRTNAIAVLSGLIFYMIPSVAEANQTISASIEPDAVSSEEDYLKWMAQTKELKEYDLV